MTRLVVVAALALAGCGSSGDGSADAGTRDGGVVDVGADGGSSADVAPPVCPASDAGLPPGYPAPHAPFPVVTYYGGPLITRPEVVTVTFPGDALAPKLEAFGDSLTRSCYWEAASAGYCAAGDAGCVGLGVVPATPHVRLTTPAASSYTDTSGGGSSTLQTFLQAQVASGALPAPDANTIYALYFPPGATVFLDGQGTCGSVGGWHGHTTVTPPGGVPTRAVYAVIGECGDVPSLPRVLDETTYAASHEIVEAATDPLTDQGEGFYVDRSDRDNQAWLMYGLGEVADLCVDMIGMQYGTPHDLVSVALPGGTFTAQRIWSAAAAARGGDPCVPVAAGDEPYFNVALAKGSGVVHLQVGQSTTIEADAFSTGPLTWELAALDYGQMTGASPTVGISFDTASGITNGTKVTITLDLLKPPTVMVTVTQKGMPYLIASKSGNSYHYWPGLVLSP